MAANKKPFVIKHGLQVQGSTDITAATSTASFSGLSATPGTSLSVFAPLSSNTGITAASGTFTTILSTQGSTIHDVRDLIQGVAAGVNVKEADGSPNVSGVTTIVVSNGTLTDDGSNQVTIQTGGGGGGDSSSFDSSELAANSGSWDQTYSTVNTYSADWTYVADNSATIQSDTTIAGTLSAQSTLSAGGAGDNYFAGNVGIGTNDPTYALDVAGNIGVDQYIYHNDDTNTYINFTNDRIRFNVGGISYIDCNDAGAQPHDISFNDGSNNVDFIIKGNGSNEGNPLFKTDASTGRVGINGIGSPEAELEVDGTILATGSDPRIGVGTVAPEEALSVSGNISASGIVYSGIGSSSNWNNVYTTTRSNSSTWNDTKTTVQDVSTTVSTYSGDWTWVAQNSATIYDNLTVHGDISAQGDILFAEDQRIYFETDEGTWIESNVSDAFRIVAGGSQMLILDKDTGNRAVFGNGTKVYIGSNNNALPSNELEVDGDISATGTIEALGGSSTDWNDTRTTVQDVSTTLATSSGSWDQVYSTVQANSSTYWSSVTGVSGGIALVEGIAHLADPETLTQIAEADAVSTDRMLIWDESESSWKYITVEDLQDEIDTTGGGGGGSGTVNTGSDGKLAYYDGAGTAVNDTVTLNYNDSNHRLGIGTSDPDEILHVYGIDKNILLEQQQAGTVAYKLKNTGREWHIGSDNSPDLFYIRDHSNTSNRVVIDSDGNVGIGSNISSDIFDGSKLTVIGSISASGSLSGKNLNSLWLTTTQNSANWNTAYGWGDHSSGGYQSALTFGIANTNAVKIDHASVTDDDYAKFTASGLEGRSASEVKTDLSLNNVENTAISTFTGTTNIVTVGTIGTGTWQGTAIADAYISSADDWDDTRTTVQDVSTTLATASGNWQTAYGWGDHSSAGYQSALTFGIANTNAVKIDHASVTDDDYAKFTASGIEGRSASEVKTDLSLNNVENTAISTFTGTTNIATVGTIGTGTWQGTAIADAYISSADDWNDTRTTVQDVSTTLSTSSGSWDQVYTTVEANSTAWGTDTNTTYTAGNGLALGGTEFTIVDPATLNQLTETTDAIQDKILLWDETASEWKYMTLDDLQDSIDTTGGGGGGGSLDNVVEDTTPQLGGDLDLNSNNITGTGNYQGTPIVDAYINSASIWNDTRTTVQDVSTTLATSSGSWDDTRTTVQDVSTTLATASGNWQTAYGWGDHSSAGYQSALTFGIANTNAVKVDHASVADDDYAKFTANGLEGRSTSEVKTDLSLNNVENTAISTFTGTTNIVTVGTIGTGTWQGTAIADTYISSADDWNDTRTTVQDVSTTLATASGNWQTAYGWGDHSSAGYQSALTFGIANTNAVKVDHASVADDDYAKFTANGLEGRSSTEVKTDLSLNNVENTAISTFTGTTNIATVGTIGTGTWQGTAIADGYIDSADDWNQVYSTVQANSSTYWSSVTGVSGGIALVEGVAHLADPANGTSIDESTIATDDRMLIWDESASSWKYVTIDNLQDEIDTTGGGSSVSFGTDNQIPYMNAGGDDFEYSANFTWGHGSNELKINGDIEIAAKIFHKDDSNTFLHFVGADDFRVVAGGKEYFSIDATTANEVCINEQGESFDFRVEGDTDENLLFVDGSADKVGIGTAAPAHELTVAGSISARDILTVGNGTIAANLSGDTESSGKIGIGLPPTVPLDIQSSFDFGIRVKSTDAYSLISFGDNGTTGNDTLYAGALSDSFIVATGNAERVRINSTGLGIGTAPSYPVHISSDNDYMMQVTSTDAYSVIAYKDNSTTGATTTWAGALANNFVLATDNTERMRINSSGVGIKTANTDATLTVNGDISASNGYNSSVRDLGTHTTNGVVTFDIDGPSLQRVVLKANMTSSYLGVESLSEGRTITVEISACGANRNLAFDDAMLFIGEKPSILGSGKCALLSITTFGTLCANASETDVRCAYGVEE